MQPKRASFRLLVTVLAVLSLVAAACGSDDTATEAEPTDTTESTDAAESTETESTETESTDAMESSELTNITSLALILPGPISDADYNAVGYEALQGVGETLGIEVEFNEQTPVPDATRIAESFIADGFDVIAFHGGQFLSAALELAAEFPDTQFLVESSGVLADQPANVYNIGRLFWPGYYVLGTMAGLATESNTIGFLGGIEIPDYRAGANAFFAGARSVNPDVELLVNFTGDFNDPVAGRQAAEALIGADVDVLVLALNNAIAGVAEAANAADSRVLFTSSFTDKSNLAPELFVTAVEFDFEEAFEASLRDIDAGNASGYYEMYPGQSIRLTELLNLDPEVRQEVQDLFDSLADGSLVLDAPSFDEVLIPVS